MNRIRCAVCHRYVDKMWMWHDLLASTYRIKVRCHGQEDTMEITEEFFMDLTAAQRQQLETQEGIAFDQKRISE